MNNKSALTIENVEKNFGEVTVLRGVNATLKQGSITAFIGPNGAGKTTLFHAITGDITTDSGAVILNGEPVTGIAPWKIAEKGLGKMFQDVRVFENLTLIENILVTLHARAKPPLWASFIQPYFSSSLEEEAIMWLTRAGVQAPFNRCTNSLSFGNKKLLALARLMAGEFDVLLLDEPTAGLSPDMIDRIELLIRQLSNQGVTIALIEHNYAFVTAVADYTYLLERGAIRDEGITGKVLGKKENREVLIGL